MKKSIYLNFIFYFTGIYLLIATIGHFFSSKGEYFPFFTWMLYRSAPQEICTYDLLVFNEGLPKKEASIFNYNNLPKAQVVHTLIRLSLCKSSTCQKTYSTVISKYIPQNTCAILISKNEENIIDTLGYIKNKSFSLNNCLR